MLSASKTRAAPHFGPSCMQPEDVPKSEDCLTLNVWRDQRLLQDFRPHRFQSWFGFLAGARIHRLKRLK
jgi:hypothetical protein